MSALGLRAWATAFLWTCALELPVYGLALGRGSWSPVRFTLVVNLLTHPLLWAWALATRAEPEAVWGAEGLVVLAEAMALGGWGGAGRLGPARAVGWAALANLTSWGLGGLVLGALL